MREYFLKNMDNKSFKKQRKTASSSYPPRSLNKLQVQKNQYLCGFQTNLFRNWQRFGNIFALFKEYARTMSQANMLAYLFGECRDNEVVLLQEHNKTLLIFRIEN